MTTDTRTATTTEPATGRGTGLPGTDADGDLAPGATLVIEGPTAEAALTDLHAQLGPTARVVEVRKVHRGGIGGFFAREVVQLHAAAGTDGAGDGPPASPDAPLGSPVDRLLAADADGVVDFASFLRDQLDAPAGGAPSRAAGTEAGPAGGPEGREALVARVTAAARAAAAGTTASGVVDPVTGTVAERGVAAAHADAGSPTDEARGEAPDPVAAVGTAERLEDVQARWAAAANARLAPRHTTREDGAPSLERVTGSPTRVDGTPPAPSSEPTSPSPDLDAERRTVTGEPPATTEPGPAWSVASLVKVGLPAHAVRDLDVAAPHDDITWTAGLAGGLRSVCRPLPTGRSLLVGPRARGLANATRVPTTAVHQPIRSRATVVAAAVGAGAAGRAWVDRARGTRWLHLVVGGQGWRELLHLDPLAVSWATPEDLPEAIRLATELGLVLGSGPLPGGVRRARPLDVALAVRDLLPVR